MARLEQRELSSVLHRLPDAKELSFSGDFDGRTDALFMCSLGFEERSPWIPVGIADKAEGYKCDRAICFEYSTNQDDNEINRASLTEALSNFSGDVQPMPCDDDDFTSSLRSLMRQVYASGELPSVTLDISSFSSKLLLLTMKVLLEFNVELRVVYAEAEVYHPTEEEYKKDAEKWTSDTSLGLARGVSKVIPSAEHPGVRHDHAPEAVIAFPTFKPERTRAVIANIDQSLATKPGDRVVWIVGDPHLSEDTWRVKAMVDINRIPDDAKTHPVSTFDYKKTMHVLEGVHQELGHKCHISISPLGSKLQSVGIALFCHIRQDVSLVFAMPQEYNAVQYSEGCKAVWAIDFGPTAKLRSLLDGVGTLEIV